jgi:hypothetical protein
MELVLIDSRENPERQCKAVVMSSLGFAKAKNTAINDDRVLMQKYLEQLCILGVPFVTSSGNYGNFVGDIHRLPKILAGPDMPIINVVAVTHLRELAFYSEGGPQLTLCAPGASDSVKLKGQSKRERDRTPGLGMPFLIFLQYTYGSTLVSLFVLAPITVCHFYLNYNTGENTVRK